jgi:nicotinamidase-related amidase
VQRGADLNAFEALVPGRTALVVVDMQNIFMAEDQVYGNAHARDIVPNVNALAEAMRAIGAPVIWTRQTHADAGPCAPADWQYDQRRPMVAEAIAALRPGARGQALHDDMDVREPDVVIDKHRYGAFSCPAGNLRRTLASLGTRMIVLVGTATNCCCESTAREANMDGYQVIVVSDANAAPTDAEHNAALLNLRVNFADVRTTREVLSMAAAVRDATPEKIRSRG